MADKRPPRAHPSARGRQQSSLLKRTLIALYVGLDAPTSSTILARGVAGSSVPHEVTLAASKY